MNAKIISIWGANGSGKTTTAVNLAFTLAQRNFTVGVISSNVYYGEMQTVFGLIYQMTAAFITRLWAEKLRICLCRQGKHLCL